MNKAEELLKQLNERFNLKDDLLGGITYQELIDTVESNEPRIDAKVVMKVYDEILKFKLSDAKQDLKSNMKLILAALS